MSRPQTKELTDKQKVFMRYIAQGLSNSKIAERMDITRVSVEGYVDRINIKLDLFSKQELKQYAIEHGYLQEVVHE